MLAATVERSIPSSSSSSSSSSSGTSLELDPLLKDLSEKRQFFKKNVQSLASDLKDARTRLARKDESFARETQTRKAAETKVKDMEDQICQLQRILDEKDVQLQASTISANQLLQCPKNFDNINRHLSAKDEEIVRLRDEIRFLSTHWKHKTKELQAQTAKHQRTDQELKKRVLKLEFCLQEARSQTRKFQRMGKRTDNALKELKYQFEIEQQKRQSNEDKHKIWEKSSFKMLASMSMVFLVVFARR